MKFHSCIKNALVFRANVQSEYGIENSTRAIAIDQYGCFIFIRCDVCKEPFVFEGDILLENRRSRKHRSMTTCG